MFKMSNQDKLDLVEMMREMVQKELKECICRTIKLEKAPRQQGDPKKDIEIKEVDFVSWIIEYAPLIEGRYLGLLETIADINTTVDLHAKQIDSIGNILFGLERGIKNIASLSDALNKVKHLQNIEKMNLIEVDDESNSEGR